MKFISFCLMLLFLGSAWSYNILVVAPIPSYSHFLIPSTVAKELAARGYHITCISPYPQKTKITNYTDVRVIENIPIMTETQKKLLSSGSKHIFENLTFIFDLFKIITNNTLSNKHVQNLLTSNKKFDLIIVDHFFNEALVGLGNYYEAPVVLISSGTSSAINNFIFANPAPASYIPGKGAALTKHMSFWRRIENFLMNSMFAALLHFYHLPKQEEILQKYFSKDIELDNLLYNTSLMLTNSHVSVSGAVPLTPNIIEIGGIHINPKALPDELQTFLDEAKEGVIFFSLGSILRSDDLKPEMRAGILKAFSKIKQKVLWKFEAELPEASDNVKIMHWLPQQDILAHPNIRVFISHGGLLSMIEAVFFGVPVIGIPVFGDQLSNVASAVEDGYAIKIDVDKLTEETLSSALEEILSNSKYKESVAYRSKLLHDRPLKPIETAIFWIEHVIRHKGALHLRSAGVDLKWYQREMLDIFIFLIFVIAVILVIIQITIKKLLRFALSRTIDNVKIKKNN